MTTASNVTGLAAMALMLSTAAFAQTPSMGIVTTAIGTPTVTRSSASAPQVLLSRDAVLPRDRITTDDRSGVRLLLGGRAVVTMRERSVLTIDEIPGVSTIELSIGRITLATIGERIRPGACIEIKTPNAIVRACGKAVVIAEAMHKGAEIAPCPADVISRFTVAKGFVSVAALAPTTERPRGNWVHVVESESLTLADCEPLGHPVPGDIRTVPP